MYELNKVINYKKVNLSFFDDKGNQIMISLGKGIRFKKEGIKGAFIESTKGLSSEEIDTIKNIKVSDVYSYEKGDIFTPTFEVSVDNLNVYREW